MSSVHTRPVREDDVPHLVALALRAWEPVIASLRETLGEELFRRLRPDWRGEQEQSLRTVCQQREGMTVHVAEVEGTVVGFVGFVADRASGMGVVEIVGVDPAHHNRGIGSRLTALAFDELRAVGMRTAMVETGGDPGHAPARRTYEKAGCTPLPIARYFTALDPA